MHEQDTYTHLDLSLNGLSDTVAHCIFQALQQNTTLIYLNLANNKISGCEDNAQALLKLLQVNKTLTHLILSDNVNIFAYSLASSRCILEGLQQNTTLVHLNLANTGIYRSATKDTTCIRALTTTMLQVNTSLTHLNLSYSDLSSGVCSIFKILQHNTTLVHLELSITMNNCHNIESTFQALNKMLKTNKALAYLKFSHNGISESYACSIFKALRHNTALVHLDLNEHSMCISDKVAVCIAGALEFNCSLQILIIPSDWIGNTSIGFAHIVKSLGSNTTLRELHLCSGNRKLVKEKVQGIHRIRQEKELHPVRIAIV